MTDLVHLRVQHNRLLLAGPHRIPGLRLDRASPSGSYRWTSRSESSLAASGAWPRGYSRAMAIGLSAFGIYLGRFRRWNSWDVARDPFGLISDVAGMVLNPFAHVHVVAFSVVLAAFLLDRVRGRPQPDLGPDTIGTVTRLSVWSLGGRPP